MDYERGPLARQGTHDGLCGVYCLINAMRNNERFANAGEDLLRYLLEAAYRINILIPSKISHGYEAHEITDIFNEFARSLDIQWNARLLSSLVRDFPKLSLTVLVKRIFEEGGEIVIHTSDFDHWFLAYSFDLENKRYLVEDSDGAEEQTWIAPKRVQNVGVVLLPTESALHSAL